MSIAIHQWDENLAQNANETGYRGVGKSHRVKAKQSRRIHALRAMGARLNMVKFKRSSIDRTVILDGSIVNTVISDYLYELGFTPDEKLVAQFISNRLDRMLGFNASDVMMIEDIVGQFYLENPLIDQAIFRLYQATTPHLHTLEHGFEVYTIGKSIYIIPLGADHYAKQCVGNTIPRNSQSNYGGVGFGRDDAPTREDSYDYPPSTTDVSNDIFGSLELIERAFLKHNSHEPYIKFGHAVCGDIPVGTDGVVGEYQFVSGVDCKLAV